MMKYAWTLSNAICWNREELSSDTFLFCFSYIVFGHGLNQGIYTIYSLAWTLSGRDVIDQGFMNAINIITILLERYLLVLDTAYA